MFKTHVKDETEVAPSKWNDYRYMVNIVTSKFFLAILVCLRIAFDIHYYYFPRCHCEYTAVSRSILFLTLELSFF